jgi:hypothetical protein
LATEGSFEDCETLHVKTGKISFLRNAHPGDLYDLTDEQKAYERGNLFGDPRNFIME